MAEIPTEKELQVFALNFDNAVIRPLVRAGYDKYNVFDILNINRQELRHSDFLAFLLDPSKRGNIGHQFLRNFLTLLAKDITSELDFFDMLYGNIDKVNVYREIAVKDGRIDILFDLEITKNETQKIVVAIENKVDSDQHDNQLEKYKNFLCSGKYKNHKKVMLYLTPNKANSSYTEWLEIDYKFIFDILQKVNIDSADNIIKTLIEDYKKIIEREFDMNNEFELKKQALEIYRNNKKVLDFIFESKPNWIQETSKILSKLLEQKGATIVTENKKQLVPTTNRGQVNLMFRINELANYPTHYFQICVNEMSLLFVKNSTQNQCPKQWLFGNKQDSSEAVEKYQQLVLNDNTQFLEEDCKQMVEKIFEPNGAISKALATLN